MIKLVVIADDFTGALDTAVQFAKRGIKTLVTADNAVDIHSFEDDIEVLSIDIESRHLNAGAAYDRVRKTVALAMSLSPECIYKKTDSTLRGQIGAEFAALLDETGSETLMFIPAFPKNERTTKGGVQYVKEVPLSESVFANDPINPVKDSRVANIISSSTEKTVVEIPFSDGLNDADLEGKPGGTIFVFDAENDEQLKRIGKNLQERGKSRILSGCAGFAEVLPDLFDLRTHGFELPKTPGNMLVVVGSANQVSQSQILMGEQYGFELYPLSPEEKIGKMNVCVAMRDELAQKASDSLKRNGKVIVAAALNTDDFARTGVYAAQNDIPIESIPSSTVNNIAYITKLIISKAPVDNLVIFGGDTLMSIMETISCQGIIPYEEIAPGIVVSKLIGSNYSFTLVTKSGSFGEKDVIDKIYEYLQC